MAVSIRHSPKTHRIIVESAIAEGSEIQKNEESARHCGIASLARTWNHPEPAPQDPLPTLKRRRKWSLHGFFRQREPTSHVPVSDGVAAASRFTVSRQASRLQEWHYYPRILANSRRGPRAAVIAAFSGIFLLLRNPVIVSLHDVCFCLCKRWAMTGTGQAPCLARILSSASSTGCAARRGKRCGKRQIINQNPVSVLPFTELLDGLLVLLLLSEFLSLCPEVSALGRAVS